MVDGAVESEEVKTLAQTLREMQEKRRMDIEATAIEEGEKAFDYVRSTLVKFTQEADPGIHSYHFNIVKDNNKLYIAESVLLSNYEAFNVLYRMLDMEGFNCSSSFNVHEGGHLDVSW